jgi:hypothetical protein
MCRFRAAFGLLMCAVAARAWCPGAMMHTPAVRVKAPSLLPPCTLCKAERSVYGRSHLSTTRTMMTDGPATGQAKLRPVILCPAQFGTANDYDELKADLRDRGFDLYPAPLKRFDWVT